MFRSALAAALVVGLVVSAPAKAADAQLKAAVAGAQRSVENRGRDGARHPIESLAFWGLKPKSTVVEVVPGGGYWTEILAPYAKATGGVYVAGVADLENPKLSDGARKGRADFEARYSDVAKYGTIKYAGFGPTSAALSPPGSADMVITSRNIHNFIYQPGMLDKAMHDFHAALKRGGVLAVEEHRADPRPEAPGVTDGYVATATVVAAAERAGFKLAGSSEVNANPKDTKDHPFGVWTLPPNRRNTTAGKPVDPAFDGSKYEKIGESDRMTLRFVKR